MSTLDHPNQGVDPSTVSPWPTSSRYGLIGALILIVAGLGMYLGNMIDYTGQDSSANWISNIVNWGIMIAVTVLAVKKHRDEELGGYISFGRAFQSGFFVNLVITLVTALWTFIFFSFVAPDLLDIILEASRDQMIEQQGLSGEDLDNAMGFVSWMFTPTMMTLFATFGTLIFGAILSVIVGLVMKKE